MEENEPLVSSGTHRNYTRWAFAGMFIIIVFLVIGASVAIAIALSSDDSQSPNPPPTQCPTENVLLDTSEDFPLYNHPAWNISQNHLRNIKFTTDEGTW